MLKLQSEKKHKQEAGLKKETVRDYFSSRIAAPSLHITY